MLTENLELDISTPKAVSQLELFWKIMEEMTKKTIVRDYPSNMLRSFYEQIQKNASKRLQNFTHTNTKNLKIGVWAVFTIRAVFTSDERVCRHFMKISNFFAANLNCLPKFQISVYISCLQKNQNSSEVSLVQKKLI